WAKFSYGQTLLYFYALKGNLYCLRANFIVSSQKHALYRHISGSYLPLNPLNRQCIATSSTGANA
uniref:hypothetical protein n=1 Tax=Escherichia coli TaxID=562 RepID=UPI001B35516A